MPNLALRDADQRAEFGLRDAGDLEEFADVHVAKNISSTDFLNSSAGC